jgi:hypothetical protein
MAEPSRYRGIARNGKVELEPGAGIPDGSEVTVLFAGPITAGNTGSDESMEWLLGVMRDGFDLGGGSYFDRNTHYGDTGRPQ